MKRPLRPDETSLWAAVVSTVQPAPGRSVPVAPQAPADPKPAHVARNAPPLQPVASPKRRAISISAPERIEPRRRTRLARERDPIGARLDLHGLDQDRAREALHAFVQGAHARGLRAVLVITGKGTYSGGILRRRTPEWLVEPPVRALVAGISQADRRHGGEGAIYVALKRKPAP